MDSTGDFHINWNAQTNSQDEQFHYLFTGPTPSAVRNPVFGTRQQNPFETHHSDFAEADHDVNMTGNDSERVALQQVADPSIENTRSRPADKQRLDWDSHKAIIKDLYIDQNKSLPETMKIMGDSYSFHASQKLYKTKFREWKWQKNLPVETAIGMAAKATRRKREEGKDTVFTYAGRTWDSERVESTAMRSKRVKDNNFAENAQTPKGVSYKTPVAIVDTPPENDNEEVQAAETIDSSDEDHNSGTDADSAVVEASTPVESIALTWRGLSRTDLQNTWRTGLAFRNAGNIDEAENMLNQTFLGLSYVLGQVNGDTIKAGYNLADLYAVSGRMGEAIAMLERIIQSHVATYGVDDRKTQQNIAENAELLNGWNRPADALALLSRSKEVLEFSDRSQALRRVSSKANRKNPSRSKAQRKNRERDISGITNTMIEDMSPTNVDDGLAFADLHSAARNDNMEKLLLTIISQCRKHTNLNIQHLKAFSALLQRYDKSKQAEEHEEVFEDAFLALKSTWSTYLWEEESFESFDFMEASLQLVADVFKYGFREECKLQFRAAKLKAEEVFGFKDERTVWVLISIGLVYQNYMTWTAAAEWFEAAFSAALANSDWGKKDGIVRSLQNAMDHQHFSYVSDEGRPFKSIFGVTGITIRPARLHLA